MDVTQSSQIIGPIQIIVCYFEMWIKHNLYIYMLTQILYQRNVKQLFIYMNKLIINMHRVLRLPYIYNKMGVEKTIANM